MQLFVHIETRGPAAFNGLLTTFKKLKKQEIVRLLEDENSIENNCDETDSSVA